MLSFESSLSNIVDDGDDDSRFLLGLATSRAALGGSWVLDFHDCRAQEGNPLLASISRLLRHAGEDSGSILLTPKLQEAGAVFLKQQL